MTKEILAVFISTIVILSIFSFALAQPPTNTPPNLVPATNEKSGIGVTVTIPSHAVEVAPGVFQLPDATNVDGRVVQGFMFVDYKNTHAKPPGAGKGGGGGTTKCYSFLASGAKWKTVEPWVVNPTNTEGLDSNFVLSNLASSIQKWETASGINILGDGSTTNATLVADTSSPDGVNEVYFGNVGSSGAIAVTIVWGIFGGPPSQRKLVEWDQVYDQVDFDWSATGEANKMDFENINAHELGHSNGMGHPDDSCTEETMFRFASTGETKKRDLNAGDIAGIQALY